MYFLSLNSLGSASVYNNTPAGKKKYSPACQMTLLRKTRTQGLQVGALHFNTDSLSKSKAFAGDNFNLVQIIHFLTRRKTLRLPAFSPVPNSFFSFQLMAFPDGC